MKTILNFTLIFLLYYTSSSAQDTVLTFFNKEKIQKQQQEADGYYIKEITIGGSKVAIIYVSEPFLRAAPAVRLSSILPNGPFTLYNYAGKKLKEGRISDSIRIGSWNEWYEDGNPRATLFYLSDTSETKRLLETDSVPKLQIHEKSLLVGVNRWYHRNGKLAAEEHYSEKGFFIHGSTWNEKGEPGYDKATLDKYGSQQGAYFKGGSGGREALRTFVREQIKYPEAAKKERAEGICIVQFAIDEYGVVTDYSIRKSTGNSSLDAESIRVAKEMSGYWDPAKMHNIPVVTYYLLPITYKF